MGQENTVPRRINGVEGAAGQVMLSGGPGVLEIWGAPAPAVHGADKHTDVTREVVLPANAGFVETGTPNLFSSYGVVDGGANAWEPRVYFIMKVPDDFASFTSVKAIWSSIPAAGNMYWQIHSHYGASGESYFTHGDQPAMGVTATGGGGIHNVQEPANPLTLVNLAAEDILGLYFSRNGTDANDTLDGAMRLFGLLFTYVANQ